MSISITQKAIKGNVFIGWNIDDSLAVKVKEKLKLHGYNAIVGGKNNDEVHHGVGATIVAQMKACSSAIMLFSPRKISSNCNQCGSDGGVEILSGNMLYELGYLTASLKLKRVLTVYIDNAIDLAPSDLKGGWDFQVKTKSGLIEKTTDEIATEIVDFFLQEQKDCLTENKMEMVTDISALRSILVNHTISPVYYETEIAIIVLLFCQSAYMVGDMENSEKILKNLLHAGIKNNNCLMAISSSFDYFSACRALTKNEYDNMYLPRREYKKLKANFLDYIDEIDDLPDDDEFKCMFLMIAYDYLTFINMMFYSDVSPDELDEETLSFRENCAKISIKYSQMFRDLDPQVNSQLAALYESYTFRNLALFYKSRYMAEEAKEYFEKSITARRELYRYFRLRDIDDSVFDQINMEYHLALIDNIFDVEDSEKNRRIVELKNYVEEVNEASYNREYLIEKISNVIDKIKKG